MPFVIACPTHHVAYVENEKPFRRCEPFDGGFQTLLAESNALIRGQTASGVPLGRSGHDPTMSGYEL